MMQKYKVVYLYLILRINNKDKEMQRLISSLVYYNHFLFRLTDE